MDFPTFPILAMLGTCLLAGREPHHDTARRRGSLFPALEAYLDARAAEFDRIDATRESTLRPLADWIFDRRRTGRRVDLLFVCTHNSRRSHMGHLWMRAAAIHGGLEITSWSGGTETTAFDPRAVAAMSRAGFDIEPTDATGNPIRKVGLGPDIPVESCFSKHLAAAPNPRRDFAAIMVCDDADRACPVVAGSSARFAIPFLDPKASDGTPVEAATYDERCAQIAREMLWIVSRAAGR